MKSVISAKAQTIPPFIVMEVLERAQELERSGQNVIHLEVGEPDFDTPEPVKQAAYKAIKDGETHYTHSLGMYELREAIAEHYLNKYSVDVSPDQIIVTSGTSPAMLLIFSALLNEGDEVILSNPYYACYPNFIRYVGGKPVFVNIYETDGFQYRVEEIQASLSHKTRGIMINSPSNPTGNLINEQTMCQIAQLTQGSNEHPFIISDEIYHGLVYEGKEHSILEFTERAFVINGFSKLYAMTGWRLGYAISPKEFIRPMQKLQQNFFISAAAFVQRAGIAALKYAKGEVQRMVQTYAQRRKFMLRSLRELGF